MENERLKVALRVKSQLLTNATISGTQVGRRVGRSAMCDRRRVRVASKPQTEASFEPVHSLRLRARSVCVCRLDKS